MNKTYNWGILGPGKISHKFAQGLAVTEKGKLFAVGSRDTGRAREFAEKYGAEKYYGSYEELAADPDIDIIYIATPHHLHYELTRLCFDYGKNVLCEKPVCINSRQFEELRKIAGEKKLFYMDALWTRFLPTIKKALEIAPQIGPIKTITADFGFKAPYNENSRLFDPELGGGTLLDIGLYTVLIPMLFLGVPDEIIATAFIGKTGVDESSSIIFKYSNGAIASLSSTFLAHTKTQAEIAGSEGRITFMPKFFMPTSLELLIEGKPKEVISFETKKNGYECEAEESMLCLDEGLLQSPLLPHSFTSDLMKILDEIRRQMGVRYSYD